MPQEVVPIKTIEASGVWNVPGYHKDSVEGTLHINPIDGFINLIVYSEKSIGLMREIETITGITTSGSKVTLVNCSVRRENIKVGSSWRHETVITAKYALDGIRINSKDEIVFHDFFCRFSNLDEWAFLQGFELYPVDNCDFSLTYRKPEVIKYNYDENTVISIETGLTHPFALIVEKDVTVTQKVYVSINHKVPQTLEKNLEIINVFMGFVSLGIGTAVNYTEIFGHNPNHYEPHGDSSRKFYHKISMYDCNFVDGSSYRPIDPRDTLLGLQGIKDNFSQVMHNWFEKWKLLEPIIELYLNTLNYSEMSLERHFLCLVQALESYHRRTRKNALLPKDEHKKRTNAILESVPYEHREWLQQRLSFSNEPTLKDRLLDLSYDQVNHLRFIGGTEKTEEFVNKVKNTRNYHTHYDTSLAKKAVIGEELIIVTSYLKVMVEYYILKEIGIPSEHIREKAIEKINRIKDIQDIKSYWKRKREQRSK